MLTYAAICPAASIGTKVAEWTTGEKYVDRAGRLIGPILAGHWVLLITCGASIRSVAEAKAAEFVGGRVIEVRSKYWPGQAQVEDAITALGIPPPAPHVETALAAA